MEYHRIANLIDNVSKQPKLNSKLQCYSLVYVIIAIHISLLKEQ